MFIPQNDDVSAVIVLTKFALNNMKHIYEWREVIKVHKSLHSYINLIACCHVR